MTIHLTTYANGEPVTPQEDALVYQMGAVQDGIISGGSMSVTDGNKIYIRAGHGIIWGRKFRFDSQSITVPLSGSGTVQKKLIIKLDLANDRIPIQFKVIPQAAQLIQDKNVNIVNGIWEIELATFSVSSSAVSGLVQTFEILDRDWLDKKKADREKVESELNNLKYSPQLRPFEYDEKLPFLGDASSAVIKNGWYTVDEYYTSNVPFTGMLFHFNHYGNSRGRQQILFARDTNKVITRWEKGNDTNDWSQWKDSAATAEDIDGLKKEVATKANEKEVNEVLNNLKYSPQLSPFQYGEKLPYLGDASSAVIKNGWYTVDVSYTKHVPFTGMLFHFWNYGTTRGHQQILFGRDTNKIVTRWEKGNDTNDWSEWKDNAELNANNLIEMSPQIFALQKNGDYPIIKDAVFDVTEKNGIYWCTEETKNVPGPGLLICGKSVGLNECQILFSPDFTGSKRRFRKGTGVWSAWS